MSGTDPLAALGALIVSAGLVWGLNSLALGKWRRASGIHWTEQAALLHPARVSAGQNGALVPLIVTALVVFLLPGISIPTIFLASFAGGMVGSYPFGRETFPSLDFKTWRHLVAAGLILRWGLAIVFVAAALAMPMEFNVRTWVIAALAFVLLLALRLGLGLRLMRWLRLLLPPPLRLSRIVAEASGNLGVRVKATWVLKEPASNALAFVFTKELAYTEGMLATCDDEELRAVTSHELAHLSEGRWVVALRLLSGMAIAPYILIKPIVGTFGPGGIGVLSLVSLLIPLAVQRMARKKEIAADRAATKSPEDSQVYARALVRIHQTNLIPAVMRGKGVHPQLYDRLLAAGVTPDFPRPRKPASRHWSSYFLPFVAVGTVIAAIASGNLNQPADDFAFAYFPESSRTYFKNGQSDVKAGDLPAAITEYGRAIAVDPKNHDAYYSRGDSKWSLGDFAGAAADFSQAIALQPNNANDWTVRGTMHELLGAFPDALADYERAVTLLGDEAVYARLRRTLAARRLDSVRENQAELLQAARQWKDPWPRAIAQYLTGNLAETDFLTEARNADPKSAKHQLDAFYYAGMNHLLAHDFEPARQFFTQCLSTDLKRDSEFDLARAELERLKGESSPDRIAPGKQ